MPLIVKGGSSKKAKEAAAVAAQAAAAAASAASAATVQVRILLDDGTAHVLQRSIDGRSEPVGNHHFLFSHFLLRTVFFPFLLVQFSTL